MNAGPLQESKTLPHGFSLPFTEVTIMAQDHGPSIKNDEQYEALREQGMSQEKAARIANSGPEASRKGGQAPAYEEWTKDDLLQRAREIGLDGRSKMNKGELIEALRDH